MSFSWCWQPYDVDGVERQCTLEAGHKGDHGPMPTSSAPDVKTRPQPAPKRQPQQSVKTRPQPRPGQGKHVRSGVADLLEPQEFRSWVPPDKDPRTPETVHRYRDNRRGPDRTVTRRRNREVVEEKIPGELLPVPTVTDRERDRRRGGFQFEVEMPPLIDQLAELRGGNSARIEMSSGRRAPSSRPPAGADVADLEIDITVGAQKLLRECLEQLGRHRETRRVDTRNGTVTDLAPDVATTLRRLAEVADDVDAALASRIARTITSWRNNARLLLSVNSPMATLQLVCPMCGEQTLTVRSDASSDVFCGNPDCVDENGHTTRWPRSRWAFLLAEAGS